MDAITTALETLTSQLQALTAPLAVLGVITFILAFLISPLLPDAMSGAKGYIQKALLAVAFVSFLPTIMTGLAAIGG